MSTNVTGVVERINEQDGQWGKMYSIVVNGDFYGAGKYPPRCAAGDTVTFEVEFKGKYKNIVPKSLSITGAAPKAKLDPAQVGWITPAAKSSGFGDDRQEIISKQAALNTAIAFIKVAADFGAIPVAASAKPEKKLDVLDALVKQYASEFYGISTGKTVEFNSGSAKPSGDPAVAGLENPEDGEWK